MTFLGWIRVVSAEVACRLWNAKEPSRLDDRLVYDIAHWIHLRCHYVSFKQWLSSIKLPFVAAASLSSVRDASSARDYASFKQWLDQEYKEKVETKLP